MPRLEIAMDDARRVHGVERRADGRDDLEHLFRCETTALGDEAAKIASFEELHREVRASPGERAELVDLDDRGMPDHVDDAHFAKESGHRHRRLGHRSAKHLDGNRPPQNPIFGEEHRAATARGDGRSDRVRPDVRTWRDLVGLRRCSTAPGIDRGGCGRDRARGIGVTLLGHCSKL